MSLKNFLGKMTSPRKRMKEEIDQKALRENLEYYRNIIAYLCSLNPHNTFKFYFFQRMYLRICLRYKTVYAVFSRGFSKSFLAVLSLMIKAILYPGAKLATAADGK